MRRNFLVLGASCLGSLLVTPSYICNKYSFTDFKNINSQLKSPTSCLTQLIAMHTGLTEKEVSRTEFFFSPQKISCSLDIPEQLLERVFVQRLSGGQLTYLHVNSIESFWLSSEHRKQFAELLKSPVQDTIQKLDFPKMTISYSDDNFSHARFAKMISKQLSEAGLFCSETPLAPVVFSNTWKQLEFPIVDWQAVGLEPQLLAQLMFDEHSNWSLKNAKPLLEASEMNNPKELYNLAIKLC
jgi:hypothetical protein